jgi:putative transposase
MRTHVPFRSNRNIVYSCKYPIVWCPKYRHRVLANGVDKRLKEMITNTAGEFQADRIEMEVMPDHVHLLVEADPQFGIHRLVKQLKGRSSRLPSLWTNSYFVSTVGGAPLEVIQQSARTRNTPE